MNLSKWQEVKDIVARNTSCITEGGQNEDTIKLAETELGVSFPESYRTFLKEWGSLGYSSVEYFGLNSKPGYQHNLIMNSVTFTLAEREYGFPPHLVVFRTEQGDTYYCLDCSQLDKSDECPVVEWDAVESEITEVFECSFDDFLLEELEELEELFS